MIAKTLLKLPLLRLSLLAAVLWPVTSDAAELLVFGRDGCAWCQRWDREVGSSYGKTDEARVLPLRYVNIDRPPASGIALVAPVRYTPTFVVVNNGREIGRITGYVNDDAFWGLLSIIVSKMETPRHENNPSWAINPLAN
ncbi:thioredoxin family protein [Bradyrhizobium sp.]|uniref:thioredoxin family protein n=2 Tax=Bradyrhizobium sp. TaxID=376 RepID=UPI0027356561|nr:thioredoxin family protein [Bradyrhizobium sp.]MDP3074023.1 thioredoxin family protein [Bradyrhizobium sp.]